MIHRRGGPDITTPPSDDSRQNCLPKLWNFPAGRLLDSVSILGIMNKTRMPCVALSFKIFDWTFAASQMLTLGLQIHKELCTFLIFEFRNVIPNFAWGWLNASIAPAPPFRWPVRLYLRIDLMYALSQFLNLILCRG